MNVETSLKKLFSLHKFGVKLGLENTTGFLNHIGNPQLELKTIHIAGSNGKGSTASYIASILQENGFKTGLYTSPHFVKFNERVQINGVQIDDKYIAEFVTEYEKYIDQHQLTFFEVTTAMAFKYFREMKTDYCVIETGLGGRLDSTNVLNPLAVVITSISLEHTNVLGNTIKHIASEKAAIIKSGAKVFTGILPKEAEEIVKQKCSESENELFKLSDFIKEDGNNIILPFRKIGFDDSNMPLRGRYQKLNAALAALAISKTFLDIESDTIKDGIEKVVENTGIQGRYEFFHTKPDIIFDSAHNPEGVSSFISEFSLTKSSYRKNVLLFGAMRDKAIEEMLRMLKNHFDVIYLTQIEYERAAAINEIKEVCKKNNIKAWVVTDPSSFVRDFMKEKEDHCLVVLGSMYLLGEVKTGLLISVGD